jgi:S1-C subfamily serine protease
MIPTAVVAATLLSSALAPGLYLSSANTGTKAAAPAGVILAAGDLGTCGAIGVKVRKLSTAMIDSLGLTERYGAVFDRPQTGSAAAQAGIQAGDVVTAINGKPLQRAGDFAGEIAKRAPNTRIYLTVWRSRQMMDVPVVLGSGKCPSARGSA